MEVALPLLVHNVNLTVNKGKLLRCAQHGRGHTPSHTLQGWIQDDLREGLSGGGGSSGGSAGSGRGLNYPNC